MRLLRKHYCKILSAFSIGLFFSCTSVDSDRNTNFAQPLFETQVDFTPYTYQQRDRVLLREKAFFDRRLKTFKDEMADLQAQRNKIYLDIQKNFPDCENHKHCMSQLSKGSVARFERYSAYLEILRKYDAKLVVLEDRIQLLERTRKMRERAVYNRYLVHEFINVALESDRISSIRVHSLEAFDLRRQASHALFRFVDTPTLLPAQAADLDFRMFGLPIDEGSVIATYDVHIASDPFRRIEPVRFIVSFLVNMQQIDTFAYQRHFRSYWARKLLEPGLDGLMNDAFCGFYSIASNSIVSRLQPSKVSKCSGRRTFIQNSRGVNIYANTDYWMLPLGFQIIHDKDVK
ncbi:MAG: hypothetical protein M9962_00530 [Oligoflexia bacterium]|nr:hypothetical protein [Oligoflexia bacterium]